MGFVDFCNRRPSRQMLLRGEIPIWIQNSPRAAYITQIVLSCPDWVDRSALRVLKARAKQLTDITGILHVLDHEIPLNHPLVCGLTVPWNLKVVPWKVNALKSNRWEPNQIDFFDIRDTTEIYETLTMFDFECA